MSHQDGAGGSWGKEISIRYTSILQKLDSDQITQARHDLGDEVIDTNLNPIRVWRYNIYPIAMMKEEKWANRHLKQFPSGI